MVSESEAGEYVDMSELLSVYAKDAGNEKANG